MDDSAYHDIPDEPELAFLYLEELFFREFQEAASRYDEGYFPIVECSSYISKTLAARSELGLDILTGTLPAQISEVFYQGFRRDVVYYRTAMQIRFGKRTKQFSVHLDIKAKRTVHHYIGKIREFLQTLEVEERKKERLFDKLLAFEGEVDRDRTRYEAFGAAVIEFGAIVGEATSKADPARKWIDSIAGLIWGAKDEELKQLPSPPDRKRIEPPPKEMDDEIPF